MARLKKSLWIFLFFPLGLSAQQYLVSGFISDSKSGEPLIGATVYEPELKIGTTTNQAGYYSIYLPAGRRSLQYSYLGFDAVQDSFFLGKNIVNNVVLEEGGTLSEVVIIDKRTDEIQESPLTSTVSIPMGMINHIPALLGEIDFIKAIQMLPGVQAGMEGSSGLYVRGGTPDQNLILLDGVPVYNINHLFGFFSAFNSESISSFNLIKGGFPARYGSRLSSVLDINIKEGNNQDFTGVAALSFISGSLFLEGPIANEKTTFSIGARRSLLDLYTSGIQSITGGGEGSRAGYFFYDITGKITHRINDKNKLFFTIYNGKDKFFVRSTDNFISGEDRIESKIEAGIDWGNITSALRWGRLVNEKVYANYSINYTRYQFNIRNLYEQTVVNSSGTSFESFLAAYFSGIQDISAKVDYEHAYSAKHFLRYGGNVINHGFAPGALQAKITTPGANIDTILGPSSRILGNEFAAYIEDDIKIDHRLRVNVGLRLSAYQAKSKIYSLPEPRFSGRYMLNKDWAFKASYSLVNQYLHLLTNSGLGLPTDLWVPATDRIKPQRSHQFVTGLSRTLPENMEFSVEAYYKTLNGVIDYAEGAEFINVSNNWEDKVEQGKGTTYGMEVLLQKKQGELTGWIGYTLAYNTRQFDNINNGNVYFFRYDRRHTLSITGTYELNDRYILSANLMYASGNPITFPYGRYIALDGSQVLDYVEKNGYRMRDNFRIDAGFTRKTDGYFDGDQQLVFSVYNLTNYRNPFYMYLGFDNNGDPAAYEVSLLPFIPSITYILRF